MFVSLLGVVAPPSELRVSPVGLIPIGCGAAGVSSAHESGFEANYGQRRIVNAQCYCGNVRSRVAESNNLLARANDP
jgi:hypothetical protein